GSVLLGAPVLPSALRDGKLVVPSGLGLIEQHELPDEMIEAGPEVVGEVAETQAQADFVRLLEHIDREAEGPFLKVGVFGEGVRVAVDEVVDLRVQGLQVLPGLPQFGFNPRY